MAGTAFHQFHTKFSQLELRIDIVDIRASRCAQESLDHGKGHGLHGLFRQLSGIDDLNALHGFLLRLVIDGAQFFTQFDVGSQPLHISTHGRHVDGRYQFPVENGLHQLGYVQRAVQIRFLRRGAQMRSKGDLLELEQWVLVVLLFRGLVEIGFHFLDIHGGTGHLTGLDRLIQSHFVDHAASGHVDDPDPFLAQGQFPRANEILVLRAFRNVQRNQIRAAQELVDGGDSFHTEGGGAVFRDIRIIAHHVHAHTFEFAGHDGSDFTKTDDTGRFALELLTNKTVAAKIVALGGVMRLRHIAEHGESKRDAHFRSRHDISLRCVHNGDATAGAGWHINVVDAVARAPGHLEVHAGIDDILADLCGGSDDDAVIFPDDLEQLLVGNAIWRIHFESLGLEVVDPVGGHLVGHDDFRHLACSSCSN